MLCITTGDKELTVKRTKLAWICACKLRDINGLKPSFSSCDAMLCCLQSIVSWWHHKASVAIEVASMGPAIVAATVDIYQAIKRDLLPTPAKSHYTYNMRDLSKVFQGISMVGVPVDTPEKMTR